MKRLIFILCVSCSSDDATQIPTEVQDGSTSPSTTDGQRTISDSSTLGTDASTQTVLPPVSSDSTPVPPTDGGSESTTPKSSDGSSNSPDSSGGSDGGCAVFSNRCLGDTPQNCLPQGWIDSNICGSSNLTFQCVNGVMSSCS